MLLITHILLLLVTGQHWDVVIKETKRNYVKQILSLKLSIPKCITNKSNIR
jgi:hypothetical protein